MAVPEVPLDSWLRKEGEVLYFPDPRGLLPEDPGSFGLYYLDTRHLSCLDVLVGYDRPAGQGPLWVAGGAALRWETVVTAGCLFARVRIERGEGSEPLRLSLGADFRDIFEVRGVHPFLRRGPEPPRLHGDRCLFQHLGRDGVVRRTLVRLRPPPSRWQVDGSLVRAAYRPGAAPCVEVAVAPLRGAGGGGRAAGLTFAAAREERRRREAAWAQGCTGFRLSHPGLQAVVDRAGRNLADLWAGDAEEGVLHAGAPWFAAPFGRDSLIAAWAALPLRPDLARGTLRFLARRQGRQVDLLTEEEPGKILHELRRGELAGARLVPHAPYYGSVDATPLWAACLGAACRWSGDAGLAAELEPHLAAALAWCSGRGDLNGDGFIEYRGRRSPWGLAHEGWKDSWDGVVGPDGGVPEGPIALVEVQGYHHAALRAASALYDTLGRGREAAAARRAARALARRFRSAFWGCGEGVPALALDGRRRPVCTAASNLGHLLATGPLNAGEARSVARRLLRPDFLSGWGVRTLPSTHAAYDPMSYHNGSVWPHDTAIAAFGLRRRGLADAAARTADDLLAALSAFAEGRIPELYSGRQRQGAAPPEAYPGACTLQAWSSAAVFLSLRVLLGLWPVPRGLAVVDPRLPRGVDELSLRDLRVGRLRVALRFLRAGDRARCEVLEVDGPGDVLVVAPG